jgi:ATP-dependent RNA helicase DDX24/MAK5
MPSSSSSSKGGEKKKSASKKFKLGSKARRALRLQKQGRRRSGGTGEDFENAAGGESKKKTTKKTTFAYDESRDEELKRLRAFYSNPSGNDDDEENNEWSAIDVDASELMLGSSEEGFVSLEVLDFSSSEKKKKDEDDEDDEDDGKKKKKKKKEDVSKKKKKKQEESVAVVEEEEEKEDVDGSEKPPPSKKEARILKRKKRWKEKVEEAKRRKKMAKMNEKVNGVERKEDDADENEEKEDKRNEDDDDGGGGGGGGGDFAAWLEYDLHPLLLKAIRVHLKFTSPTPIQEKVLHPAIKGRMDIVGAAETGSGKTLAFGLPILQRLMQDKEEEKWYEDYPDEEKPGKGKKHLRALIVTPTRELALQVAKMLSDLAIYTDIQIAAIVGGMAKQKQERVLKKQPEIIVATPGRLWELIRDGEKHLTNLERMTFLTLDEADRMVERGHFKELESVIKSIPEPPETRRIARSAKLTKRKQPMMTKVSDNSGGKKNKKKGEKNGEEEEQNEGEEDDDEEKDPTDNRIMARDRQTFVFSATLTVPDEVKYKLDRKKPQASSKKASGKRKNGDDNNGDDGDDENAYRLEPPKDLASTNTMGNLMKMVPFYGRVKLCDVSDSVTQKKGNDDGDDDKSRKAMTTKVASKVHESALECTDDERDALTLYLLSAHDGKPSIVFVNAISSLRRLTALLKLMKVNAVGLHAGMQQRARLKALDRFKSSKASALIATDVAARGLDIKGVELVVHYQVPRQADAYVHRCGRTGRANQSGVSVALVTPKERSRYLAMLAAMGRERGFRLPPFPVAEETVREATKRVQLAKRLDAIVHKNEKKRADKAWKKRTAEAMDLGLDADDDSDFDDDDDSDQDVMQFSDNEDGVEVIEDFKLYGKKKMKKELTQKKLEKEAEKRNVTKRETSLRNELERLLKTPLGAKRRSMLTSQKFPTREGGKQFEKVKQSSSASSVSALDVLKSGGVGVESGPAAGAVAGGAMGARKKKSSAKFK